MHRTKAARQALALQLLGTPSEPGPLDVGWLKARYGIAGSHIKRWREQGIPEARVDDLALAIQELTGTEKAPPPEWAAAMEQRLRLELERNRTLIEALAPADIREAAARVIERLEALPQPDDAAHAGTDAGGDPAAAEPPGREPESRRGRVDG